MKTHKGFELLNPTEEKKAMIDKFYEDERNPDNPALINEALAALANPQRGILGYQKGRASDSNRRMLQNDLVAAQKFMIDDSLIRHCVEAGMDTPANLVKMALNSRPCFDLMWIEWDDYKKIEIQEKAYPKYLGIDVDLDENYGVRCGYLIKKINGKYLFMTCGKMPDGQICFLGHGFYFSCDEPFTLEWANTAAGHGLIANDTDGFFKHQFDAFAKLMGPPWVNHWIDKYLTEGGYPIPDYPPVTEYKAGFEYDWFATRVLPCQANFGLVTRDEVWKRGFAPSEMLALTNKHLDAMIGDLRFLITALAFLNYDHVIYEDSKPEKVPHIRHGRRVPQNEYRTVTINLPKRCKVARRNILTGTGTPKRQHWRRGHYRLYRDAKGNEKRRVWIEPQIVGNPENGFIDHDYELRGK